VNKHGVNGVTGSQRSEHTVPLTGVQEVTDDHNYCFAALRLGEKAQPFG
jgi:hypothetical protein